MVIVVFEGWWPLMWGQPCYLKIKDAFSGFVRERRPNCDRNKPLSGLQEVCKVNIVTTFKSVLTFVPLQLVGDLANPILGSLWSHRPGQLRADRDQGVHEVLGPHHVRELLHHQHHSAAQPPDRHDEPQLPAHLRQLGGSILNPQ